MRTPDDVLRELEAIEKKLAEREDDWATAAEEMSRLKRAFELRWAQTLPTVQGTVEEKKARTLTALAASWDDYGDFCDREAELAGARAAREVLEHRASILQSTLKALTQEAFRPTVQHSSVRRAA